VKKVICLQCLPGKVQDGSNPKDVEVINVFYDLHEKRDLLPLIASFIKDQGVVTVYVRLQGLERWFNQVSVGDWRQLAVPIITDTGFSITYGETQMIYPSDVD